MTIRSHPEFVDFSARMEAHFAAWRAHTAARLKALQPGFAPKELITDLAEGLLAHYSGQPLLDAYDIFQHLMDFWATTLQDDAYLIAAEGWKAETYRIIETDKKGKERDKGWTCDLVPKPLIVARYFAAEQQALAVLEAELESVTAQLAELEEDQGGEDGAFAELDKVNRASVSSRLKEIGGLFTSDETRAEAAALQAWLDLNSRQADLKRQVKEAEATLDAQAYAHYASLTEADIKTLVVDDKWLAALEAAVHGEMERLSQRLTQRVKDLAERYAVPMPELNALVTELEKKVSGYLKRMGFAAEWKMDN